MSLIVHHAIIVTSWDDMLLSELAGVASGLGAIVSGPSTQGVNGYRTLTICPDGSKEGWDDSINGDARRAQIKTWMDTKRYDDRSCALEWVEVAYGNDLRPTGPYIVDSETLQRGDT